MTTGNITELEWHATGVLVWREDVPTFYRFEHLTTEHVDTLANLLLDMSPIIPHKHKRKKS